MGRSRPSTNTGEPADTPPSVGIEIVGAPGPALSASSSLVGDQPALATGGQTQRTRIGAIAGLVMLAALMTSLLLSGSTRSATVPNSTAPTGVEPVRPAPATQAPAERTPEEATAELISQLPTTSEAMLVGQVLAWIGEDDQIHVRRLSDGVELETGILAQRNLPPLPEHIRLLGAPNSTWLLDLTDPAQSGKLSNSVRMVRLGSDLDSYGFISTTADETQFFVGSLWGPSMNGTARAPLSTTVFAVPQTGIVVASQNAISGVVEGDGIRPLPTRLGRVVAAGESIVAGIHCDDLGRCIGRVTDWQGNNEVQIDAAGLSATIVRISPNGRFIVAASNTEWRIYDLELESSRSVFQRIGVNDSLTWSADSDTLLWISNDVLLAIDVHDELLAPTVVRQVGEIGARLPESDVAVLAES